MILIINIRFTARMERIPAILEQRINAGCNWLIFSILSQLFSIAHPKLFSFDQIVHRHV